MSKWTAAAVLLWAGPLFADEIVLKNGSSLKGVVTRQSETTVTLEMAVGTIEIPRHQIEKIIPDAASVLQEFEDRYRAVQTSSNPADFWTLADWCCKNGATNQVRPLVERAIRLEPSYADMDRAHFVARLIKSGVSTASVKSWIALHLIDLKIEERDRERVLQAGLSRDLVDALIERNPAPAPLPPVVQAPVPSPPPPKPAASLPVIRPKPWRDEPWQRLGYPEAPYSYPIVIMKNPWPYVPTYYGPYIYYVPYGNYPVITTPPSTGSYR